MDVHNDEHLELISGYLDNELNGPQRERVDQLLATSPAFRREFDAFKSITVGTDRLFHAAQPPDAEWDTFLDGVYNRMERKTGWLIFCLGALALALYGGVLFYREPWGSALVKLLISLPVAGLAILFYSVLRQRLHALKSDRYEREVHR
ncbi:MAG: hypothetical protein HYV27_20040 [Candidatus Hydrogenedentes bacterium]|nr:hypothetical protein [Candidatus Hydrogenedentota bacterium]